MRTLSLFSNTVQRMLYVPQYTGVSKNFLQKRFYSGRVDAFQRNSIEQLANSQPNNAGIQAKYLSLLNNERDYQSVIQRYESRQFSMSSEATVEYLKALASISGAGTNNMNYNFSAMPQQPQQPSNHFSSSTYSQQIPQQPPQQSQQNYAPQYPTYQAASRGYEQPNHNIPNRFPLGSQKNPLYFESVRSSVDSLLKYAQAGAAIVSIVAVLYVLFWLSRAAEGVNAGGIGSNQGIGIGGGSSSGSGGDLIKKLVGTFTYEPIRHTNKSFNDIKGIDPCMDEIKDVVSFLKDGQKFRDIGAKLPKGILLVGPPGVGKTLLAKAIAGEADVPFFYATGSEFDEVFVGVGAARIKGLFESARKHAPCIIFIDEIDSLGAKRSQRDIGGTKQTINQLLAEMDGFKSSEGIIVIGATNLPKTLDNALVRPGRFDKVVEVTAPDVQGRKEILDLYFKDKKVNLKPEDIDSLAKRTIAFTGADLENLVNEAAIRAAIKNEKTINWHHIEYAYDRITLGLEHRFKLSEEEKMRTAVHEAGHAIITLIRGFDNELHKVTINPRGRALGLTFYLPSDNKHTTKFECLSQIEKCLGGIVAEEIIYGKENVTLGASNDLEKATSIARSLVTVHGLSNLGYINFQSYEEQGVLETVSAETKHEIDKEVKRIIDAAYVRVKDMLTKHESDLRNLSSMLVKNEEITGEDIKKQLNWKPSYRIDKIE